MTSDNVDWKKVLENTSIIRFPNQKLATFGNTSIKYYVVTEPLYKVIDSKTDEGVVRTGNVMAEKPTIITPFYAMHLQGFSDDAYKYFKELSSDSGQNTPGILYQYRNEPSEMEIVILLVKSTSIHFANLYCFIQYCKFSPQPIPII